MLTSLVQAQGVLLGAVPLAASVIKVSDDKTRRPNSIEISLNNDRKYFLQASSEEERALWLEKLTMLASQ